MERGKECGWCHRRAPSALTLVDGETEILRITDQLKSHSEIHYLERTEAGDRAQAGPARY